MPFKGKYFGGKNIIFLMNYRGNKYNYNSIFCTNLSHTFIISTETVESIYH
jgi:hypothetical protein